MSQKKFQKGTKFSEYDPKEKPPSVKDMLNAMKEAFK